MTDLEIKKIRALAKLLPVERYSSRESVEIKGSDLLLTGIKVPKDQNIDESKNYLINAPVLNESNHYRRMKKAFKRRGKVGVVDYMARFTKDRDLVKEKIDILFK